MTLTNHGEKRKIYRNGKNLSIHMDWQYLSNMPFNMICNTIKSQYSRQGKTIYVLIMGGLLYSIRDFHNRGKTPTEFFIYVEEHLISLKETLIQSTEQVKCTERYGKIPPSTITIAKLVRTPAYNRIENEDGSHNITKDNNLEKFFDGLDTFVES